MSRTPTPAEREALSVIHRMTTERGMAPSIRELGAELGLRSTNAVVSRLRGPIRDGLLIRQAHGARSLRLTAGGRVAIGAPCCVCSSCACACHQRRAAKFRAIMLSLRHGPAAGESLEAFAVRMQRAAEDAAGPESAR